MKKNLIITVVALILVILGEYLIWDKIVIANEVRDYDLAKAKKLVDKFYTDNYIISDNVFKDGLTERYKITMAFNEAKDKQKEYECEELYKDSEKDDDGIKVGDGTFCDGKVTAIQYADLEKAYKNLFGNDSKLVKKSVGIFDYVKDENLFTYLSCRCGGVDVITYVYKVKDAKIKGSKLTINVYYDEVEEPGEDFNEEEYLKENVSKMDVYEMEFVKENKTFKLLEVKKVS